MFPIPRYAPQHATCKRNRTRRVQLFIECTHFPPLPQCRSSSSLRLSPPRHSASRRRPSTCVPGRSSPSHPPLGSSLAAPAWSGRTHRGPGLVLLCTAEVTCCAVRRPQVPDRSRPELPHAPGHAPQDGRARRVPRAVARDPRQRGLVRTEPLVGTLRPFLILLSNQDRGTLPKTVLPPPLLSCTC
eukprot:COSAG01_NODE_8612_length_2720_cov_1.257917_5_plen_186_part_00